MSSSYDLLNTGRAELEAPRSPDADGRWNFWEPGTGKLRFPLWNGPETYVLALLGLMPVMYVTTACAASHGQTPQGGRDWKLGES
jgi:hypothetical protein